MSTVQHDDGQQESHVNIYGRNENSKTEHVNKLEKTSHSSIDMYSSASQKSSPNQGAHLHGHPTQASLGGVSEQRQTWILRVGSALFYALASFMIMVINKRILTVYKFPSFQVLGLGQMVSTIVILLVARRLEIVSFPSFSPPVVQKIWPLPLFYVGNMIFGLGGTQALSLPMMTVLRRFSVLMTMVAEYYIVNVRPQVDIQLSVFLMIFGALVAAFNDLAFNLPGYTYILLNDVCTAGNGVVTKKKLEAKDLGKYGLLFYNSMLMLPLAVIVAYFTGDIKRAYYYEGWTYNSDIESSLAHKGAEMTASEAKQDVISDQIQSNSPHVAFIVHFLLSCVFGFILMFATLLCTQFNSALTTTIIGCLKNIVITYSGMIIGGDYVFSWWNFIGLNISAVATLLYTRITFGRNTKTSSSAMGIKDTNCDRGYSVVESIPNSSKRLPDVSVRKKTTDYEQTAALLPTTENDQ